MEEIIKEDCVNFDRKSIDDWCLEKHTQTFDCRNCEYYEKFKMKTIKCIVALGEKGEHERFIEIPDEETEEQLNTELEGFATVMGEFKTTKGEVIIGTQIIHKIKEFNHNVSVYGSKKEIEEVEKLLPNISISGNEHDDRLIIQKEICPFTKASILYDGNTVWNKDKILKDIRRVIRGGMGKMTDYLYKFLSLACGSIAHFNKYGWIEEYPEVEDLRSFFKRNEYGHRVLDHLSNWNSDVKVIVVEIEKELHI